MSDVQLGALVGQLRMDMGNFMSDVNKATKAALGLEKQLNATRLASVKLGRSLDLMGRRALTIAKHFDLTTNALDRLEEMMVRQANTSNLTATLTVQNFANMKNGVRKHVVAMTKDVNTLRNETLLLRHAGKGQLLGRGAGIGGAMGVAAQNASKLQWALKEVSSWANRIATASFVMAANFGIAAVALGRFVFLTSKAASNAAEITNRFNELFREAAPKVNKQIEELSKRMAGFSKNELRESASLFAGMLQNVGMTNEELGDMSVKLAGLAVDISSFYNIASDAARDKLFSALAGEIEPARAIGVIVDEASVKNLAKSYGILGAELTQNVKTLLRYKLIVDSTKRAQGDFTRTQLELANQMRLLKSEFNEFMVELGEGNHVIARLVSRVRAFVSELRNVVKQNPELTSQIMKLATALSITLGISSLLLIAVPLLAQTFNLLVNALRLGVWTVTTFNSVLAATKTRLASVNLALLNTFMLLVVKISVLAGLILFLKNSIDQFFVSMRELGYNVTGLAKFWESFKRVVVGVATTVWNAFVAIVTAIPQTIHNSLHLIITAADFVKSFIARTVYAIFDTIVKVAPMIRDLVKSIFSLDAQAVADTARAIRNQFISALGDITVGAWGDSSKFADSLIGSKEDFKKSSAATFSGIGESVSATFNELVDFAGIWGAEFAEEFSKSFGVTASTIGNPIRSVMESIMASVMPSGSGKLGAIIEQLSSAYNNAIEAKFGEDAKIAMDGFEKTLRDVLRATLDYNAAMDKAGIVTWHNMGQAIKTLTDLGELARKNKDAFAEYQIAVKAAGEQLKALDNIQMPTTSVLQTETNNQLQLQIQLYKNLREEAAAANDPHVWWQAQNALDELNSKTLVLNSSMQRLAETSGKVFRGLTVGMQNFVRQGLNLTDAVSAGFENVANTFTTSFTNNIYDAITGAITLEQAMKNVFAAVIESLIKTAIQIGVNYALASALSALFMTQLGAEAAILAGLWSPAAILASIATLGAAAAVGQASVAAALGAGMATNAGMSAGGGGMAHTTAMGSYAKGLDYVPKTGVYRLHPGERVQPAYDAVKSRQEREDSGSPRILVAAMPNSEVVKAMMSPEGKQAIIGITGDAYRRNTELRRM